MAKKGKIVLVRHGESRWNLSNLFTGWVDVPLSEKGIREAHQVSQHCEQYKYDAVFTSTLGRARETLSIILSKQELVGIIQHKENSKYHQYNIPKKISSSTFPIFISEKLNERAYGDLQGMNKNAASKLFGKKQVFEWRRGFETRPPGGESLKDVYTRTVPYFKKNILNRIKSGETVLITGHGNTLRALLKFLENLSDDEISFVNLPTGKPLVYEYRKAGFVKTEGMYNLNRLLR